MKTEVHTFCTEFLEKLHPFSTAIQGTLSALSDTDSAKLFGDATLHLNEIQHRLSVLHEKMEEQQAFLLIFGPLKSGKSTLMNAISGAYVSEVSSLPAYPALVYVKNGEEKQFQATTYSGEKINYADNSELTSAIEQAHKDLAQRILEVEKSGQQFDPKQHSPEAIRRMDLQAPAESLAESATVLVDTPGLYSRMRFGYDQMTQDFRDTAACAIFVVKTDNLFFEKVFEEFNQLLGCFSRIFLVANIDTSKKDLNPDGSLRPSVESHDPARIIEAFENLSMSAPLKEALNDGRLRVYPIDLLKAASKRLSSKPENLSDNATTLTSEDGFDTFIGDLSAYLDSSDYLHDFMADSLRFGTDLRDEAARIVDPEFTQGLRLESEAMENELIETQSKLESYSSINEINWDESFETINGERDQLLGGLSEKYSGELSQGLASEVDSWMETDNSLAFLHGKLKERLESVSNEDGSQVLERLSAFVSEHGGGRFSANQIQALANTDLNIEELNQLSLKTASDLDLPDFRRISIEPSDIPVRRKFMDYLLFRSPKRVSQRFFGKDNGQPIMADVKKDRIDGPGVEVLKSRVTSFASTELVDLYNQYINDFIELYAKGFASGLEAKLTELKQSTENKIQNLKQRLKENDEAQKIAADLYNSSNVFNTSIQEMKVRYNIEATSNQAEAVLAE